MPKTSFDHASYPWRNDIDYRAEPEKYRVGKGEQGVLICEPYKSEILPFWHFRTLGVAQTSADKIESLFNDYLAQKDFVGADMARKFLQMGYTRARRYTNYKSGRKYDGDTGEPLERGTGDPLKAESATIFYEKWRLAEQNPSYKTMKKDWKTRLG